MRGDTLPRILTPIPGPASRAWVDRLAHCEGPGVTYRRSREGLPGAAQEDPIVFASARGSNVTDADGNVLVDLSSSFGVTSVGHAHPEVARALARQARTLPHAMADVYPDTRRVELLEALRHRTGLERGILGSSGSDAVEAAVKTARMATGRHRILAFQGSYHGLSYGNLATTGYLSTWFRGPFGEQVAPFVDHVPFGGPLPSLAPYAAILVEPIQGRGGVNVPPSGWLARMVDQAHQAGTLVIFDEIFTGFGRTGAWFAFQHEGVVPDLLCVGKGLSSGFPISACMGRALVMDAWGPSPGEALHTQTFLGSPLGCAMALAAMEVMGRLDLPRRAARVGRFLMERLRRVPGVTSVRGRGLMVAAVLEGGGGPQICRSMLQKGWICLPTGESGDAIQLTPPLTIPTALLEGAVEALSTCLEERR